MLLRRPKSVQGLNTISLSRDFYYKPLNFKYYEQNKDFDSSGFNGAKGY